MGHSARRSGARICCLSAMLYVARSRGSSLAPGFRSCFAASGPQLDPAGVAAGVLRRGRAVDPSLLREPYGRRHQRSVSDAAWGAAVSAHIIRFPGCGVFDPENSWVLRDATVSAHRQRWERCDTTAVRHRSGGALLQGARRCGPHHANLYYAVFARHGLGQMMLEHCAREGVKRGVRQLSLTVTEANLPARHLYEQNGFRTLHRFEAMVHDTHMPEGLALSGVSGFNVRPAR